MYGVDITANNKLCVAGVRATVPQQAYFAILDSFTLDIEQEFTPFNGKFYDVKANFNDCLATGEHLMRNSQLGQQDGLSQAMVVAYNSGGPLWHARLDAQAGFNQATSVAHNNQTYIVSVQLSAPDCQTAAPCHDAIYTLEIEQ